MTDEHLHKKLRHISTFEELEAAVGELSVDEQTLLKTMDITPPTQSELDEFDQRYPNFTEHVMSLLRERRPDIFK